MTKKSAPFRFKQFTVQQERAAMKVGFDGILLGAWTTIGTSTRILDVGTGTGLVALMLAQRSDESVFIDAIEIDSDTCEEARLNTVRSPWSNRVVVECVSFQDFQPGTVKYDLVVCNPPYFDSHSGSEPLRAAARQNTALSLGELFDNAKRCLDERHGRLSMVYPMGRSNESIAEATCFGFHPQRQLLIRSLPSKPFHRVMLEFGRKAVECIETEELTIEKAHHVYTEEFKQLARDFYLAF